MRRLIAGTAAGVLLGGAVAALVPASSEPIDAAGADPLDTLSARVTALEDRVDALEALSGPTPTPTPTSTSTPTPSPSPTSTPTPTPTSTSTPTPTTTSTPTPTSTPTSTPTPTPDPGAKPEPGDFPTPTSVGPTTEPTATYGGSCVVTTDNLVIEDRIVNCRATGLVIARGVTGVVVRNSIVNGGVFSEFVPVDPETENDSHPTVFTVESSRLLVGTGSVNDRAVGFAHFIVRDSYVGGSHSGMWAHNKVVVEDSYITTDGTDTHQSGLRMLKNSTLRGNTIVCEPAGSEEDGGCSAQAVFYREFGTPGNLTIQHNYFKRPAGRGPWYATRFIDCQRVDVCVNIRFTGNLFDKGQGTDGGEFPNDAGDVWSDNYWTDGVPALVDQSR